MKFKAISLEERNFDLSNDLVSSLKTLFLPATSFQVQDETFVRLYPKNEVRDKMCSYVAPRLVHSK